MNTINSNNISFGSTIVPLNSKKPLAAYLNAIKTCNLKSMQNMPVEKAYEKLFTDAYSSNYHSGVMLDTDKLYGRVLRFLGYSKGNDEFIFNQLKKIDKNVHYIKDTINDGYEHNRFEILI